MKLNKKTGKIWKRIAIAGIIIFSIIIIIAGIKTLEFRSRTSPLSEQQREKALILLKNISSKEDYNLSDYNIKFSNKIVEINIDNEKKHILKVMLENRNSSRHYLIDTDDWILILSSQIKYGGWMMNNQHKLNIEGRWFHDKER